MTGFRGVCWPAIDWWNAVEMFSNVWSRREGWREGGRDEEEEDLKREKNGGEAYTEIYRDACMHFLLEACIHQWLRECPAGPMAS